MSYVLHPAPPMDRPNRYSVVDRLIEWLRKHQHQTGGAARNLRTSIATTLDPLVAESKRKAADAAAANSAYFNEIAEALLAIRVARQQLANIEANGAINHAQRARFVDAVDRVLFGGR